MPIIHPIDSFLFQLIPKADTSDPNSLLPMIIVFYTVAGLKPVVKLENGFITVYPIDTAGIQEQSADIKRVLSICEACRFADAKPSLAGLIAKNRTNSDRPSKKLLLAYWICGLV